MPLRHKPFDFDQPLKLTAGIAAMARLVSLRGGKPVATLPSPQGVCRDSSESNDRSDAQGLHPRSLSELGTRANQCPKLGANPVTFHTS